MKTQQLNGITFHFENITHSFGRNVLSALLRVRFRFDGEFKNVPTDKETTDRFKELFPTIKNIGIHKTTDEREQLEVDVLRDLTITFLF